MFVLLQSENDKTNYMYLFKDKCKNLQQNITECADMYIAGLFLYNSKINIITTYKRYLLLAQMEAF